jgi:hypothetical protein
MTADGSDDLGRPRAPDPRRPHRSSRPLWLGGVPQPAGGAGAKGRAGNPQDDARLGEHDDEESICCDACDRPHDPATCAHCAEVRDPSMRGDFPGADPLGDFDGEGEPDPDLGEIVVILLVSTLAGLRDRLERDGFESAAGLVHDLVEVADDYVMRYQP